MTPQRIAAFTVLTWILALSASAETVAERVHRELTGGRDVDVKDRKNKLFFWVPGPVSGAM